MRDAAVESVAVGFFDGVHIGHRAILSRAKRVFTFRNHPLSILKPSKAPNLIMTPEAKLKAIYDCGVEEVEMVDFTSEIAAMAPEDFAERFLARSLPAKPLIISGENWRFGAGGRGDHELLRSMGYCVSVEPYAMYDGKVVSSSRIRRSLAAGEIDLANAMLGRQYSISGKTFRGKRVGSLIGFPTVNVRLPEGGFTPLQFGVYEVSVSSVRAIANVGVAPTLGEKSWNEPVLEVHFPGLSEEEIPCSNEDGEVEVSFARFIRPECKFASIEELKRRIAADCASINYA